MNNYPKEVRAYCNLCNIGFKSIDDLTVHNKEFLNKHRDLQASATAENIQSRAGITTCVEKGKNAS